MQYNDKNEQKRQNVYATMLELSCAAMSQAVSVKQ